MIIKHLNWKNPKHRHRDAPRAFAFRVGARSLAGAVVTAQAAREIARLAEDVAAESGTERTGRSRGHDRAGQSNFKVGSKGFFLLSIFIIGK